MNTQNKPESSTRESYQIAFIALICLGLTVVISLMMNKCEHSKKEKVEIVDYNFDLTEIITTLQFLKNNHNGTAC